MTGTDTAVRSGVSWRSLRRVIGGILLALTAAAAVLFLLGSWNPWHLVVLEYRFGNPIFGLAAVPVGALVGCWLALPLRDEARQRGRMAARVASGVLVVVGVFAWGLFGEHYALDTMEVARSADGDRRLAVVADRGLPETQHLKVWVGSGLAAREVGNIGRICGNTTAAFVTRDRVEVRTPYGSWRVDLDPETAVPLQVAGPRCSDGPVPATLGP